MKKIKITSLVPYRVGLSLPEFRFSRLFTREGQTVLIDEEILREALYDSGVEALFTDGVLKIEDEDFKVEVGLAMPKEENGEEVVKDIYFTLNSTQMLAYLKAKPIKEFKEAIAKMSSDQLDMMVGLAVDNKITDYEKCKVLKDATGKDVMQIIRLNED